MRMGIISALCVLVPSIYAPRPAVAQINPTSLQLPVEFHRNSAPSAKSSESSKVDVQDRSKLSIDLRSAPANSFRIDALRRDEKEGTSARRIDLPAAREPCAHIGIFQAPDVDSKIISAIPKEFASNMPAWKGREPCSGDFGKGPVQQAAPFGDRGGIGTPLPNPRWRLIGTQP
jgi:hypothetical protein